MSIELDLRHRAWTQRHGNITAIGAWIGKNGEFQPCLVLIRTGDEFDEDMVPCAIPLDDCWIWEESIGDGRRSAQAAHQFAQVLRLTDNTKTLIRIASIIHDHLGELISMRPYVAPDRKPVIAEVQVINRATGRAADVELRDV